MIKKLTYAGIIIVIIGFVVAYLLTSSISSQFYNLDNSHSNFTLSNNNFTFVNFSVTNTSSVVFLAAQLNKSANIYLANTIGFNKWRNTKINSGLNKAISLEGNGIYIIYKNVTVVSIPEISGFNSTPYYTTNTPVQNTTQNYYLIIDNTNGSASSNSLIFGTYMVSSIPKKNLMSISSNYLISLVAMVILILAGFVILIYGLIKKDKSPEIKGKNKNDNNKDYVDILYNGVKKTKKSKKNSE